MLGGRGVAVERIKVCPWRNRPGWLVFFFSSCSWRGIRLGWTKLECQLHICILIFKNIHAHTHRYLLLDDRLMKSSLLRVPRVLHSCGDGRLFNQGSVNFRKSLVGQANINSWDATVRFGPGED